MKIGIIGAGPAGMSTALFLAKKGIKSSIFEKSQFPKDKFCGECYDGRAWKVLNELEIFSITNFVKDEMLHTRSYEVNINGKIRISKEFDISKSPRIISKRKELDYELWKSIEKEEQINNFCKQNIKDIKFENDKFHINVNNEILDFDTLIWAAGNIGFNYGNNFFLTLPEPNYFFYRRYFSPKIQLGEVKMYFLSDPYPISLVLTPLLGGQVNLEIGVPKNQLNSLGKDFDEFVKKHLKLCFPEFCNESIEFEENPLGIHYYIGSKSNTYKLPKNFFIIGDSQSKVNPISGYGVAHALEQGKLLAELISNDPNPTMTKFTKISKGKLHKELRISSILNLFTSYPICFKILFKWKWLSLKIAHHLN